MKRYIVFIFIVVILITGCQREESFDFSLSYGVNSIDKISTFDKTFTVDTVEGLKLIEYEFDSKDLKRIREYIIENKLLEEDYSEIPSSVLVTPNGISKLKIIYDDNETNISWDSSMIMSVSCIELNESGEPELTAIDGYQVQFEKIYKLIELEKMIVDILYKCDEVNELPEHKSYQ